MQRIRPYWIKFEQTGGAGMADGMSGINIPSILGCSVTIDNLLTRAEEGLDVSDVIEDLRIQAIPRFVCEAREVTGLKPRFLANSVVSLRVKPEHQETVLVVLNGDSSEVSCDRYYMECVTQPAFRGFIFSVLTAVEDRVYTVGVPPRLLIYRMTLFRPDNVLDFTLCVILMYLEGIGPSGASPSLFVQLSVYLRRVECQIGPLEKMRRFLYEGVLWLLNTLMYVVDNNPFTKTRVLPHYMFVKLLNPQPGTAPNIIKAIYSCGVGQRFDLPHGTPPCPDGVVQVPPGLLNGPLRDSEYQKSVYFWWLNRTMVTPKNVQLFETYKDSPRVVK
ncbi:unknown [Human alphaherpesvirus 3]|uniref:Uncharacterized protein n=1 Tax=Human herpesvirus 3 TaxID=10335 RepID=Q0Q9Y4_HHV3|nr:unknown [Human alphaherpesvirus 3]